VLEKQRRRHDGQYFNYIVLKNKKQNLGKKYEWAAKDAGMPAILVMRDKKSSVIESYLIRPW
jgi:hypothetical protein